nr:glycosyltransferase [uncultured Pseudodesulfovibrio sp.]
MTRIPYTAEPVITDGELTDIRIHRQGKIWHMWGRKGVSRELSLADSVPKGTLPVLIGSGLGHCLNALRSKGDPIAVVDREQTIIDLTKAISHQDALLTVNDADPGTAFKQIIDWQKGHGGLPLHPVILPLYPRLDRNYYGPILDTIKACNTTDFWSQTRYPKFQSTKPRVLFFDSNYFLCREILSAFDLLAIEYQTIPLDNCATGDQSFIEAILKTVINFKPDFVLTVNHFGLDREGKLAELLADLDLPLASWFVDNPHLILFDYAQPGSDNTVIFSFDSGSTEAVRDKGFQHVHYLPLATDPARFVPGQNKTAPAQWHADVSFVGNSMVRPVSESLDRANLPTNLSAQYKDIARHFGDSDETLIAHFLKIFHPDWHEAITNLPTKENRLASESLLTWEATRQYRLNCIKGILPYTPLIVGDAGWDSILPQQSEVRRLKQLDYYEDLPRFYQASTVNFNCTSRQMPGAVNQRVFDVPACNGFLITDHRDQMENLFDLDTEAVVYRHPEEIPHLIDQFLADPKKRTTITKAARKRILAKHTYEIRMAYLIKIMRQTFG